MGNPAFDTYKIVERLVEAKFTQQQAKVVCDVMQESRVSDVANFATKEGLDHLLQHIDFKFEAQRKDIDTKFEAQRKDTDFKFEAQYKDNKILRKEVESLVNKAKFHLLSWMVALTLGPTLLRNLWQFL